VAQKGQPDSRFIAGGEEHGRQGQDEPWLMRPPGRTAFIPELPEHKACPYQRGGRTARFYDFSGLMHYPGCKKTKVHLSKKKGQRVKNKAGYDMIFFEMEVYDMMLLPCPGREDFSDICMLQ
jgi:hypothetical protein